MHGIDYMYVQLEEKQPINQHFVAKLSFDSIFNRSLKSVDLRRNNIPDEGKEQLSAAAAGKSITLQL